MRLPRKFLKFDYSVHVLMVTLMILCIPLAPLSGGLSIIAFLMLWPVICIWQVLSALVLVLGFKDRLRMYYLIAVIAYGILYFIFAFGHPVYDSSAYLSLIFVGWYTVLTYRDATYRTPSFWDLEF